MGTAESSVKKQIKTKRKKDPQNLGAVIRRLRRGATL